VDASLSYPGVGAILLDIEGTTTPVDFVYQILFPFVRAHVEAFLRNHPEEASPDVALLRAEHEQDQGGTTVPPSWEDASDVSSAVSYVNWLMERDRKSTALKSLQGKLWEEGYRTGALRGQVYHDVPRALSGWKRQGKTIGIYSSGSVLAQKLLFSHSTVGDLTPFIDHYFDTTTGPKKEPESYRRIADALALQPSAILFASDAVAELDAARAAGMKTALSVREGAPLSSKHPAFTHFDQLDIAS
jgi:enolase-phosphatase E1